VLDGRRPPRAQSRISALVVRGDDDPEARRGSKNYSKARTSWPAERRPGINGRARPSHRRDGRDTGPGLGGFVERNQLPRRSPRSVQACGGPGDRFCRRCRRCGIGYLLASGCRTDPDAGQGAETHRPPAVSTRRSRSRNGDELQDRRNDFFFNEDGRRIGGGSPGTLRRIDRLKRFFSPRRSTNSSRAATRKGCWTATVASKSS